MITIPRPTLNTLIVAARTGQQLEEIIQIFELTPKKISGLTEVTP